MAENFSNQSVFELRLAAALQDLAACQLLANSPGIGDAMVGFHAQQPLKRR